MFMTFQIVWMARKKSVTAFGSFALEILKLSFRIYILKDIAAVDFMRND